MSAIESINLPQAARARDEQQPNNWDYEEEELGGKATCAHQSASRSKSSCPRKVDVGTMTDQSLVTMTVEEFNQVLNLVASGIQLAKANSQSAAVQQVGFNTARVLCQGLVNLNFAFWRYHLINSFFRRGSIC